MNRLVIVGNGFDLAHELPTSYRDFIDDFWTNLKSEHKNSHYQNLVLTNDSYNKYYLEYKTINNYQDFKSNLFEYERLIIECWKTRELLSLVSKVRKMKLEQKRSSTICIPLRLEK